MNRVWWWWLRLRFVNCACDLIHIRFPFACLMMIRKHKYYSRSQKPPQITSTRPHPKKQLVTQFLNVIHQSNIHICVRHNRIQSGICFLSSVLCLVCLIFWFLHQLWICWHAWTLRICSISHNPVLKLRRIHIDFHQQHTSRLNNMLDDAVPSLSHFRHCSSFIAHNPLFFRYCTQYSPSISAEFTVFLMHRTPNSISYHFMCVWVCVYVFLCVRIAFSVLISSLLPPLHMLFSLRLNDVRCVVALCTIHPPTTNTWYCFDWPAQSTLSTIQPSMRHNHDQPSNQPPSNHLLQPTVFSVFRFAISAMLHKLNECVNRKKKLRGAGWKEQQQRHAVWNDMMCICVDTCGLLACFVRAL